MRRRYCSLLLVFAALLMGIAPQSDAQVNRVAYLQVFDARPAPVAPLALNQAVTLLFNRRVESVLSMLTRVCGLKCLSHRVKDYVEMRLDYVIAMFNILVQWEGLQADDDGFVHLSIAKFSL